MSLTPHEIYVKKYQEAKDKGICYECRKPLDRKGTVCKACLEKKRIYDKQVRQWYLDNGMCPRCHKNKLYDGRKVCEECKAANYISQKKRYEHHREEYNAKHREYKRVHYQQRIKDGICGRCGKRKADEGFKTCSVCRKKMTDQKRIKAGKMSNEEKKARGLCHFCESPALKGYNVCQNCYDKCVKNLGKVDRKNHPWKTANKLTFTKEEL